MDADPVPDPDAGTSVRTALTVPSRRKLAKVEDLDAREEDDIQVAKYYLDDGDYPGAYARAQDAVRLYPDDAEAHFYLAEAARRLKKTTEAKAEYTRSLQLDPDGPHAAAAKRGLAQAH